MTFCDNEALFSDFYRAPVPSGQDETGIEHIDWSPNESRGQIRTSSITYIVASHAEPDLRIIFAPLDLRGEVSLRPLFEHYQVPSDFIEERLHSVTQGSATRKYDDGSREGLKNRLLNIASQPSWHWQKTIARPFDLFVIVLDELFRQMDEQVWNLSDVFRGIEHASFVEANKTSQPLDPPREYADHDFVGLHNVAKYCIYLKEAFNAIALTTEDLISQHDRLFKTEEDADTTGAMLRHKGGFFKSINLRLDSLSKRTDNVINLVCLSLDI
ncbi:hypothetical protein G7Y89_g13879 [Cudoniella acicularis]|uniref:Uncharacterized protein n=1 Tax=Cudoniella acicularis TaxID=354080 RepID=A0A8H4R8U4_9HELO|nr:hypothetical protein G7Y89_g13879 [Cudoniella acicularis]